MKVSKLNGKRSVQMRSVQMRNVKMISQDQVFGTSLTSIQSIPIDHLPIDQINPLFGREAEYSLNPNNCSSVANYAQTASGLFYLIPGLDVSYERNAENTGWYITILRPIVITRDISWSATWGGTLTLKIDMDWNVTLTFSSPDHWRQRNQWIYGRMSIEKDIINELQYENDVKKNVARTFNMSPQDTGETYGKYVAIKRGIDSDDQEAAKVSVTISLGNVGYQNKYLLYPSVNGEKQVWRYFELVRDLNGFLRFDAEFVGYYAGTLRNDQKIRVTNTVGIAMPFFNIMVPKSINYQNDIYEIFIPERKNPILWSKCNLRGYRDRYCGTHNYNVGVDNVIVDISKCLDVQQLNDGTFNIRLVRPVQIIQETRVEDPYGRGGSRNIIIKTNIKINEKSQWEINTSIVYGSYIVGVWWNDSPAEFLLDLQATWSGLSTSQGDCATYLSPEKPRYFFGQNPNEKKLEGGVINNHYNKFYTNDSLQPQSNYYQLDEKKEITTVSIVDIVVDTSNNILNVRSLEDLYRVNAYLKVYVKAEYEYSTDFNMRICCEATVGNPPRMKSSLVDYTELVSAISANQAISAIEARSLYIAKMNSNYSSKKYYKKIVSNNYENLTRIFVNKIIDTLVWIQRIDGFERVSATFNKYQEIVDHVYYFPLEFGSALSVTNRGTAMFAVEELNNDEWAITVLKPIVITYDVSRPGNWGGAFIFEIDEYWRTKLTFTTTDGWTQKNQKMCGDFGYSLNDSGGANKYGDVIQSPPATYKGQVKDGLYYSSRPFNHSILANEQENNVTSSTSLTSETPSWLPTPTNWNVKIKDGKKLIVKKNKDDIDTIDLVSIYGSVYGIYEENFGGGWSGPKYKWTVQKDMFIDLNSTMRLKIQRMFFTVDKIKLTERVTNLTTLKQYLKIPFSFINEPSYKITSTDNQNFNASLSGSTLTLSSYYSGGCLLIAEVNDAFGSHHTTTVKLYWDSPEFYFTFVKTNSPPVRNTSIYIIKAITDISEYLYNKYNTYVTTIDNVVVEYKIDKIGDKGGNVTLSGSILTIKDSFKEGPAKNGLGYDGFADITAEIIINNSKLATTRIRFVWAYIVSLYTPIYFSLGRYRVPFETSETLGIRIEKTDISKYVRSDCETYWGGINPPPNENTCPPPSNINYTIVARDGYTFNASLLDNSILKINDVRNGGCILKASKDNYTTSIQLEWGANIGTGKFEFYFTSNNNNPVAVESITFNRKLFGIGIVRLVNLLDFIHTSEKSLVTFYLNNVNRNNILLNGSTLEFFDDLGGECVITAESGGLYATVNFSWTV
jgi:hypothetical protein